MKFFIAVNDLNCFLCLGAIPGMPKSLGGQPLNINTSDDKHPSALSGPLSPPGGDAANRTPTCQACKEIIR